MINRRVAFNPRHVPAHLKRKLEKFIEKYDGKVRLIRNKEREGLIRTRTRGAVEARGEVVLFLDAHCEVGLNWLPPLLYPIYLDRYLCITHHSILMLSLNLT